MKIAVTVQNELIFQHFGQSRYFNLYDVQDGKVQSKSLLDAAGSGHSALVVLLAQEKIDLLICGGIGGGAKQALAEAGIQLVAGAAGSADQAVSTTWPAGWSIIPNSSATTTSIITRMGTPAAITENRIQNIKKQWGKSHCFFYNLFLRKNKIQNGRRGYVCSEQI
jgi:predicted Fe-Mo cluster-binding NifX family protein